MLDGQAISGEHLHDGGLRAGQVAYERAVGFIFSETSLFEITLPAKTADYILTALFYSLTWHAVT